MSSLSYLNVDGSCRRLWSSIREGETHTSCSSTRESGFATCARAIVARGVKTRETEFPSFNLSASTADDKDSPAQFVASFCTTEHAPEINRSLRRRLLVLKPDPIPLSYILYPRAIGLLFFLFYFFLHLFSFSKFTSKITVSGWVVVVNITRCASCTLITLNRIARSFTLILYSIYILWYYLSDDIELNIFKMRLEWFEKFFFNYILIRIFTS